MPQISSHSILCMLIAGVLCKHQRLSNWTNTLVVLSAFPTIPVTFVLTFAFPMYVCCLFVEMDAARQRMRATTACKKEEERKAKEGASLSAPKAVAKGSAKGKADGKDDRPSKKVAITLKYEHLKKSPPKSSRGTSKGLMTSSGPIIKGPRCLLTNKDYAIEGAKSLIKLTDIEPCDQLGTENLGASALFDLTWVGLLPWLILSCLFLCID